jgi:hypothetical protein
MPQNNINTNININTNTNSSSILKIKELEQEYNNVLKQYEDAYINYLNQIKQEKLDPTNKSLESLPGRSFWGDSALEEKSVTSQKQCEDMCLAQNKCTGATYSSRKRYCWTRAGSGLLSVTPGSTALISTNLKNIITLRKLNSKLQNLNAEIAAELDSSYDNDAANNVKIKERRNELKKTYVVLVDQNTELERSMLDYDTLTEVNGEKGLYADQQITSLRLWTIAALILVIMTIVKQSGGEGLSSNGLFWLVVIIILILATFSLNSPQGFLLWFTVIMLVILIKFSG